MASKNSKIEFSFHKNEGAWEYFLRERLGQCAQCKLCKTVIKTIGGSTKGLHVHLETKHSINVRKRASSALPAGESDDSTEKEKANIAKRVNTLDNYRVLKRDDMSFPATISRMAACDGFPFLTFVNSKDLRRSLAALGFGEIPKSANGIRKIVVSHGNQIRTQTITELESLKNDGARFSVSFDEWTSTRNRRYMNVNVHADGKKYWNLGLIRVKGTMPAESCVRLLAKKLAMFGLSLETDIVCIVTDGASVMTKVGKSISPEHQLCYAHGMQLAVLDVLYKNRRSQAVEAESEMPALSHPGEQVELETVEIRQSDVETDDDDDDDDLELDMICESEDIDVSLYADRFIVDTQLAPTDDFDIIAEVPVEYQQTVERVRKVVRLLRRSPTKNDDKLQPHVISECGHEVQLKLDCKTRWNSLLDMLSAFLRLRNPIQKALIDLKQPSLVSDADFDIIQDMVAALEPVKIVVEALCRRETTLLSADAALKLCINELTTNGSKLAAATAAAMRIRIKERRHLASILQYLHNPNAAAEADEVFTVASSTTVRKLVLDLVKRLTLTLTNTVSTTSISGTYAVTHLLF